MEMAEGTKFAVLAPVVKGRKGEYGKLLEDLKKEGFTRVRVDGQVRGLDEEIVLDKKYRHDIEVVVDRLVMKAGIEQRLTESVEMALKLAGGTLLVAPEGGDEMSFSQAFACPVHGVSMDEPQPRDFSFNSPYGACPDCTGLGSRLEPDPDLIVPDPTLSLNEGAIKPFSGGMTYYPQLIVGRREALRRLRGRAVVRTCPRRCRTRSSYGLGDQRIRIDYVDARRPRDALVLAVRGRAATRSSGAGRRPSPRAAARSSRSTCRSSRARRAGARG